MALVVMDRGRGGRANVMLADRKWWWLQFEMMEVVVFLQLNCRELERERGEKKWVRACGGILGKKFGV